MSHGGLPPRRVDQHTAVTPRTVAPGSRATQVTNTKTNALTVEIINKPGNPVIVQDGGVLNAKSIQAYANDGDTETLIAAGANVNGLQLWSLTLSSVLASLSNAAVVQTNDVVQISPGSQIFGAVVNALAGAGQSPANGYFDLEGLEISAGKAVELVNGTTGLTHRTSAVLQYTLL